MGDWLSKYIISPNLVGAWAFLLFVMGSVAFNLLLMPALLNLVVQGALVGFPYCMPHLVAFSLA